MTCPSWTDKEDTIKCVMQKERHKILYEKIKNHLKRALFYYKIISGHEVRNIDL